MMIIDHQSTPLGRGTGDHKRDHVLSPKNHLNSLHFRKHSNSVFQNI